MDEIVARIEKIFPYDLHYQKPLSHLFRETPEELQKWELTEGNRMRIKYLWQNRLSILEGQLKILEKE